MNASIDAPDSEAVTALGEAYALLATCFQPPDDEFGAALRSGQFEAHLRDRLATIGIELDDGPPTDDLDGMREAYRRTFEAYEGSYAPPAESVYEEWHDGSKREILSGPAAHDMERRYDAIDAEIPPEYPPDHVALLLEYASLVLEAGNLEEYERFHEEHFDWIPAFHERIDETCEVPFYRWAVTVLARTIDGAENHLPDTTTEDDENHGN